MSPLTVRRTWLTVTRANQNSGAIVHRIIAAMDAAIPEYHGIMKCLSDSIAHQLLHNPQAIHGLRLDESPNPGISFMERIS